MRRPTWTPSEIRRMLDVAKPTDGSIPETDAEKLRALVWSLDREQAPVSETVLWGRFLEREAEGINDIIREAEWWLTAYAAMDAARNLYLPEDDERDFWDALDSGIEWPSVLDNG